jgi:hypothetical protein
MATSLPALPVLDSKDWYGWAQALHGLLQELAAAGYVTAPELAAAGYVTAPELAAADYVTADGARSVALRSPADRFADTSRLRVVSFQKQEPENEQNGGEGIWLDLADPARKT